MLAFTPNLSLADVLRWDELAEKRDRKGSDWCKERGFGRERSLLEAHPRVVIALFPPSDSDRTMAEIRETGRVQLADICRHCGRCELGLDVMPPCPQPGTNRA
jgi:hypothetical protein